MLLGTVQRKIGDLKRCSNNSPHRVQIAKKFQVQLVAEDQKFRQAAGGSRG